MDIPDLRNGRSKFRKVTKASTAKQALSTKQIREKIKRAYSIAHVNTLDFWESDDGQRVLRGLVLKGCTQDQLSACMGISRQTLYNWRKKSSAINAQIAQARTEALGEVAAKMFELATGATTTQTSQKWDTKYHKWVNEKRIIKTEKPDFNAAHLILRKDDPEKWDDIINGADERRRVIEAKFEEISKDKLKDMLPANIDAGDEDDTGLDDQQ